MLVAEKGWLVSEKYLTEVPTYVCVLSVCVDTYKQHFLLLHLLWSLKAQLSIWFITPVPHCFLLYDFDR